MLRSFLNFFFNNFWYKLGSVVLAILIWAIIQGEEILERDAKLNVMLEVGNGMKIKGETVIVKDVTIRGPRVLMGELQGGPLEARIRLPSRVGPIRVRVGKEYIKNWNDRLKLTVHDAYINTFIDDIATKTLPIREVIQGAPADGYFVEKFTLKPNAVSVNGLKSELKKIKEILTEPIDITGLQQSKTLEVDLVPPPTFAKEDLSAESTKVTFQIGESKTNRNFGSIRVDVVGTNYETEIKPVFVSIEIQGTPGVLSFVKRADLRAFVDVSGLAPGNHQREIQVKIPSDTVLIETFPEKVNVQIFDRKKKVSE